MSEFEILKLEVENQIALLTISQPKVLNALNETTSRGNRWVPPYPGINPLDARLKARRGHELLEMIEGFSKPVIAAINGYCL